MKDSFEPRKPEPNASKEEEAIESSEPERAESDESIIELKDILEDLSGSESDPSEDDSEVIIDLTDIVQEEDPPIDDMISAEIEEGHEADHDFAETLGVELEETSHSSSVAPKQVEEAIERVVREMLSKKIDALLVKVIEREVSKELERIRKLLLEELPDSDDL